MELGILLLCFTTAVCVFAFLSNAKSDWNPNGLVSNRRIYFILVSMAFAIAVLVRIWNFGNVPYGANQDEAMAAVDAHALADYGTDRFGMSLPAYFTGWGYSQMNVLLSYCAIPFIKIFGFSILSVRLVMLLTSLAGVGILLNVSSQGETP